MNKTIAINLIGAPGAGKSTVASELFAKMKWAGYDVELVSEFAKECIWEQRHETMKNELYIFSEQQHRMFRLNGKVKYIITDRPLILSQFYNTVYGDSSSTFCKMVIDEVNKYSNIDIFLNRTKPYIPKGRNQTEEESVEFAEQMQKMLDLLKVNYFTVDAIKDEASEIIKDIVDDYTEKVEYNIKYTTNPLFKKLEKLKSGLIKRQAAADLFGEDTAIGAKYHRDVEEFKEQIRELTTQLEINADV